MDWVIPLITLTAMEIVLGIDNIVFISILCGKLPLAQRAKARFVGLSMAMGMRIALLFCISWVLSLTNPLFYLTDLGVPPAWVLPENMLTADGQIQPIEAVPESDAASTPDALAAPVEPAHSGHSAAHAPDEVNKISVRDLILLFGGLFLIFNSVREIHHKLEGEDEVHSQTGQATFGSVLLQIALLDIIFSLDSVITAVGMAKEIWVMVVAVIVSVLVMMVFAGSVERFVTKHPTVKMLALSFLILIGVLLVAEGIGTPINKGYIYFAMAFSLAVEVVNLNVRSMKRKVLTANPPADSTTSS